MRLTLDTNICSYILRRHPVAMVERFVGLERGQLWLSAIVAAELRFGATKLASARFSASVEAWTSAMTSPVVGFRGLRTPAPVALDHSPLPR